MVKQGMAYDSQGEYIRLWVEELRGIKDGRAHFPWTLSRAELDRSGIELGVTYPNPIVIAPEWSRHTNNKKDRGNENFRNFHMPYPSWFQFIQQIEHKFFLFYEKNIFDTLFIFC